MSDTGLSIFVFEDTRHIAEHLQQKLDGFDIVGFSNAAEGVVSFEKELGSVILVVIDSLGTDSNQLSLLSQLNSITMTSDYLVLSDSSDINFAVSAMKAGATDILLKPVDLDTISEKVLDMINNFDPTESLKRYNAESQMVQRHQDFNRSYLRNKIEGNRTGAPSPSKSIAPEDSKTQRMKVALKNEIQKQAKDLTVSRILAVDDEPDARTNLNRILKREYEVETAEDGFDALKKIEAGFIPDLAILDIHMPGINGDELLVKITQTNPEVKFIILTAFKETDIAIKTMKDGALSYLNKPFSRQDLLDKVHKAITRKKYDDAYSMDDGISLPYDERIRLFEEYCTVRIQRNEQACLNDVLDFFPEIFFTEKPKSALIDIPQIMTDIRGYIESLKAESEKIAGGTPADV